MVHLALCFSTTHFVKKNKNHAKTEQRLLNFLGKIMFEICKVANPNNKAYGFPNFCSFTHIHILQFDNRYFNIVT